METLKLSLISEILISLIGLTVHTLLNIMDHTELMFFLFTMHCLIVIVFRSLSNEKNDKVKNVLGVKYYSSLKNK